LRARKKYHFGGLWTNACCSHPNKDESLENTVHRKLKQEFGFDCQVNEIFSFIYHADFDNGLSEYEFDHVFIGEYNNIPDPNPGEIDDYKWISIEELKIDVDNNPNKYTPWFRIAIDRVLEYIKK